MKFVQGKVQRVGDFVDTDAVGFRDFLYLPIYTTLTTAWKLAPAEFLISMESIIKAGLHCMEYKHPRFRERARQGFNIVVAGKGFGCGSSREEAVMALLGTLGAVISLTRLSDLTPQS